jgi:hypothetical protein
VLPKELSRVTVSGRRQILGTYRERRRITTHEQCHALKMLADAPRGISETGLATNRLAGDLLAGLVGDGLATVMSETGWAEGQPIDVVRVRISDAGRRALHTLHLVHPREQVTAA